MAFTMRKSASHAARPARNTRPPSAFEAPLFLGVRKFCLSLPEVTETVAWGHPNFRAGKRTFLAFEIHDGVRSIAFHLPAADIERLERSPGFALTPYGRGAWISMHATGNRGGPLVRELVLKSYGTVALKRMQVALAVKPPAFE